MLPELGVLHERHEPGVLHEMSPCCRRFVGVEGGRLQREPEHSSMSSGDISQFSQQETAASELLPYNAPFQGNKGGNRMTVDLPNEYTAVKGRPSMEREIKRLTRRPKFSVGSNFGGSVCTERSVAIRTRIAGIYDVYIPHTCVQGKASRSLVACLPRTLPRRVTHSVGATPSTGNIRDPAAAPLARLRRRLLHSKGRSAAAGIRPRVCVVHRSSFRCSSSSS